MSSDSTVEERLLETPLAEEHRALGARMVPFGGYAMPVQYPAGILAEHAWTRTHAGLFDVSHMGPAFLSLSEKTGDADEDHASIAAIIEPFVSADVRGLQPGQIRYALLLNEGGGIIDDLMIARPEDAADAGRLYIVVNAGTKDGDFARIEAAAEGRADLKRADDGGLLALQGPEAASVLSGLIPGVADLQFMQYASFHWEGGTVLVSRAGYTGEDGFELLVKRDQTKAIWARLLTDERVKPVGLGARDSLRLEAGLPLYGHDIDGTTSPIEADVGFAVSRRRRELADFPGAKRILRERAEGVSRKRVGLKPEGKVPAREGTEIFVDGRKIGVVTSGGFGPTVGGPIAMGYVEPEFADPETALMLSVRGKNIPARVVTLPFVPHRYHRKPA